MTKHVSDESQLAYETNSPSGRLKVSLRVLGDELDPAAVTRMLGVVPKFAACRGDTVTRGTRTYVQKTGVWTFGSYSELGWELDQAIVSLFSQLPTAEATWRELTSQNRVDVFCGLFMGNDNQSDHLKPSTIQLLNDRGVGLGLDLYGPFGVARD